MYPILILREEAVSLVILIFLLLTSLMYKMGRDSRPFYRLICFAIAHVFFDAVTVWTVNHPGSLPPLLNDVLHGIFYMTAIMYSGEICAYAIRLCYPQNMKRVYGAIHSLALAYAVSLLVLPIEYVQVNGTRSSTGPAAYVGYGTAFVLFMVTAFLLILCRKRLPARIKLTLLPIMLVMIAVETAQMLVRELLFTGGAMTIITVGFFFSLEDPAHVFEQKMYTDALTGLMSRHRYQYDLERLKEDEKKGKLGTIVFVYSDINGLREVNNRYGHQEGDRYITLVTSILMKEMTHAQTIYRMGGDEFLAYCPDTTEEAVRKDMERVQKECAKKRDDVPYRLSVSMGCAEYTPGKGTLRDAIRAADYVMYRSKNASKRDGNSLRGPNGERLALEALTDNLFTAMCDADDNRYPFVTSLKTGVTRIAPAWNEFFGLGSEFFGDFASEWAEYIHPDDRARFLEDITDTLMERKKVHSVDYRARAKDGRYVNCSCRGAVYRDGGGEGDIFAGYIINHDLREKVDRVTGLPDFRALDDIVDGILAGHESAHILKLRVVNLNRLNMLYGYRGGEELMRLMAQTIRGLLKDDEKVFCLDGSEMSIMIRSGERRVRELYSVLQSRLQAGLLTQNDCVPIRLAGGAVRIPPDGTLTRPELRSILLYRAEESVNRGTGELVMSDARDGSGRTGRLNILTEIYRDAVGERKYFVLRYQPIMDTITGELTSAEALLRWVHPVYGEIGPDKFISFLENDPCYYELGLYILRKAIREVKDAARGAFRLNVNVTQGQLRGDSFAEDVTRILHEEGFAEDRLVLELTERCREIDPVLLGERIADLRARGIRAAFDDVGTGYSAMNLLLNIPVDLIKLDREFVRRLIGNENYTLYVDALVRGAEKSGAKICFEGIEDEAMRQYIRRFGASLSQGYYYAKPLPADEFIDKY